MKNQDLKVGDLVLMLPDNPKSRPRPITFVKDSPMGLLVSTGIHPWSFCTADSVQKVSQGELSGFRELQKFVGTHREVFEKTSPREAVSTVIAGELNNDRVVAAQQVLSGYKDSDFFNGLRTFYAED